MKWIALALLALFAFYALGTDDRGRRVDVLGEPLPVAPYPYSARVENLVCRDQWGILRGQLRNTGSQPIAFATVQLDVDGQYAEAPVIRIQPGQAASFAVPVSQSAARCGVTAIRHEKDGRNLL